MELSTILLTAFSTGFFTALLNQGIGWWRESRASSSGLERDARYLAIRLAVILERFAIDCADAIVAQDLFSSSGGHAGKSHGAMPKLGDYPIDADWKSLRPELTGSALTLRNEIILSEGKIAFWEDIDRDCIPSECDNQCGKCGYLAWLLAADLRSTYNLGAFEPGRTAWNFIRTLREHHDWALEQVQKNGQNVETQRRGATT